MTMNARIEIALIFGEEAAQMLNLWSCWVSFKTLFSQWR